MMIAVLMVLTIFAATGASAKGDDNVKCVLTLLNGQKVTGYATRIHSTKVISAMYGVTQYNIDEVYIAKTPDGKETKYSADDAQELKLTMGKNTIDYLSLYTTKPFTMPKKLKATKHRSFWQVIYRGHNVIGFTSRANNISSMQDAFGSHTTTIERSVAYGYCVKGDDVEVTYFVPCGMKGAALRKNLRLCFDRFPAMDEYLQSKSFNLKTVPDNPLSLLKVLDSKVK